VPFFRYDRDPEASPFFEQFLVITVSALLALIVTGGVAAVAAFPLAILAGAVTQFGGVFLLARLFGVHIDWGRWFSG
jgi:hypothetical protein